MWDDGLIDVMAGLALFLIGFLWVTQDSMYSPFVAPLLVPVWIGARRKISEPRIGIVNFSAERVAKESKKMLGLFLFGVLTLVIGVAWFFLGRHGDTILTLPAVNVVAGLPAGLLAIPAIIVGFAYGLRRFFGYAAALLVAAVPVAILDLHPGWALIPGGVLGIMVGSSLLLRFVRKYPLSE
jgi:hypothetical protein